MAGGNFFDRFDIPADADLTQPLGGMDRPHTRAELDAATPAPPTPTTGGNYFDKFDGDPVQSTAPKPGGEPESQGWSEWARNMIDRAGMAIGAIDPNEYRGRNEDGSLTTEQQAAARPATITPAAPRDLGERFMDSAEGMANHYSPAALLARSIPSIPNSNLSDGTNAANAATDHARIVADERAFREQDALRAARDPAWREGDSWYSPGTVARAGADLLGGAAAGVISDPTTMIAPGEGLLSKMLGQAAVGGLADAGVQGGEIAQGVRDDYSPMQTAMSAAGGSATVGIAHAIPALRSWWKNKGISVDHVPDEELFAGALDPASPYVLPEPEQKLLLADQRVPSDGIVDGEWTDVPDVGALPPPAPRQLPAPPAGLPDLRGETGLAANSNVAPPQGRPNGAVTPDVIEMPAGNDITEILARLREMTGPAQQGSRRADLMGTAGVDRSPTSINARMEALGAPANDRGLREISRQPLEPADTAPVPQRRRVSEDPVIAAVLDSDMDPHAKVAALSDRIEKQTAEAPIDTSVPGIAPSNPAPDIITPKSAPGRGGSLDATIVSGLQQRGFSEHQARGIAAGVHAEAGSNPTARNPTSGAMGLGQWLGPRQRELRRRYGGNPTFDQQLDFLTHELRGGDAGGKKVLAQGDEAGVLRSYIEDFMRPAKGRETTGDMERGMAALGAPDSRRAGSTFQEPDAPTPRAETPALEDRADLRQDTVAPETSEGVFARKGDEVMAAEPAGGAPSEVQRTSAPAIDPITEGPRQRGQQVGETGGVSTPIEPSPPAILETRPAITGPTEQVVTARGRPVDTQFEVREARDLVSSSDGSFDQRLQPRDRANRSSSDAQIAQIASRLDPEQLHTSRQAAQGAPIIGPDRMVESGNGRVSAIRRAYELHPDQAASYRSMIERRGMSTDGFEQPVLVRRRTSAMTDDDRAAWVREANERDTMGMSSTEQAKADAGVMSTDTLGLYRGGAVSDAGNREFVRSWMDRVATPAERNQLMQPDGTLSADGVRRMRSSLLAKAYDSADLVAKIIEDPDTEIRAIGNTLTDAAPGFAKLRERVAAGDLPREYDITHQVADAANMIASARHQGQKIGDAFKQDDMFGGRADPVTEAVARLMFKDDAMTKPRSAAAMADGLRFFQDEAGKHSATDMFGGAASPARAVEILDAARRRMDVREDQKRLFKTAPEGWDGADAGMPAVREGTENFGDFLASTAEQLRQNGDKRLADLAEDVGKLVADLEVKYGPIRPEEITGSGRDASRVAGFVGEGADGSVNVRLSDADHATAAIHEGLHAAVGLRYGRLRDAMARGDASPEVRSFDRLYRRAMAATGGTDTRGQVMHALENLDEFLAYGMTEPSVQAWLKARNAGGLWGQFVDGVRRLVGLAPRHGSILDRVLEQGARIIDDMKAMPANGKWAGGEGLDFAMREDGTGQPGERSWGKIGDMLFDPEFRSGDSAAMTDAIKRAFGDPKAAVSAAGDRLRGFGEAVAYSTDSALRSMGARFNAPTLSKLADMFHAEAGVTARATGRTFTEAVARNNGRFLSRLDEALKPHRGNDASMGRIRDLLADPKKSIRASAAERAAAGDIRDLLAETLEYRRDAGEAIGEVKDGYFPRQLRQDRVFADPDAFLRGAEAAYREIGVEDPAKAAAQYLQRSIDGHLGIADGVANGSPGATSAKAREFGKAADHHLRDFYDTSPLSALTTYLTGAVKRAEETRRFGAKGREGSPERAAWMKDHGDKTQWDVMRSQIQDELRANGQRQEGLMDRIEALRVNSLGRSRMGSPKVGAAVSVIHAWNQLSTLGRSMVASLPELSMGFVRAGPRLGFTHLNTTLGEFVRNVRKLEPSDAARYAEAAGAIGADNSLHLLKARADDVTANVATTKILDQFYRKNGLEGWTRAGRTAAVKTAQRFMSVLADDMASTTARTKARAAGYLRELGVTDPDAFATRLRAGAPSLADLAGDTGHSAEYATALLRFANQTVLMPSRSVKPSWASHPLGSLVFALQSYNYAFKKNVLDRVGRETLGAIKERDPAKLAAAAGLVVLTGTTAAVQGLRHAIWGSPVGAEKDTGLHYALETLDRTGLFGAASPLFNAFDGLKYQRSVGQSLQGSVLGRTSDGLDAIGGLVTNNKDTTNSAERKATGAFYDLVINPAESAIGAGVLRGAAGSALIVGHGVRSDNGILPADRSAFVDTVGGPKPVREGASQ